MSAEPLGAPSGTPALPARIRALRDEHAALWNATLPIPPRLGARFGLRRHLGNARAARRLIDALAGEVEALPDGEAERRAWRESVRERLQDFGQRRLGWPAGYRRLLFADEFFDASMAFAREARRFAPGLRPEGVWQALRNVWIGNSLQMLLGLPLRMNPSLFAYSMLYPLTDNLLDDPGLSGEAKRAFNRRFGRRLEGLPIAAASGAEEAVFELVARIEAEFPRRRYGEVFESLLAIHRGQVRSLRQQDTAPGSDTEILAISCEKGGSSVVADLYLLIGTAEADVERFAFGYGVALQLLDDLQDAEADRAAGHHTLSTRALETGTLDELASRLLRFLDRVIDGTPRFAGGAHADRRDLLRRNCRMLLVGAVADQPRAFSPRFRRALGREWPLSLASMCRLRRRAERRFRRTAARLEARTASPDLLDWLLAQDVGSARPVCGFSEAGRPSAARELAAAGWESANSKL